MASAIVLDGETLFVANQRFATLLEFAVEVGGQVARSDAERGYVRALEVFLEHAYPGIDLDLAAQFPTLAEQKLWAVVFHEVARRVFLRTLGNHRVTHWQTSFIGQAYAVAQMLARAVQTEEPGWCPPTGDDEEAAAEGASGVRS